MWNFAFGLFLVYLDNKSLRLAAIYGLSIGGSALLLGSLIGYWVDRNKRLKGTKTRYSPKRPNHHHMELLRFLNIYIQNHPSVLIYNPPNITRFSQLVPWKHESVGRVHPGHQLGKRSDVRWIISAHEGSFVFIIHPT